MYHKILLALLFLIVIYLLYQNYNIQREIYKIKNSFEELNNFLDLSIKKTKPKVLDTLSSINTTDITDNIVTYSNDVKRVQPEATVNSEEQIANEDEENNDDNDENKHNKEFEIVHLQDTSDDEMGSFNLRVFNNIKNSLVTQLNTSSPNEEVTKDINNLVVLSPKDSDTSESASGETASSETVSSKSASSKSASSETASSKSASSKSASSKTASSKSASSKNESPKKIDEPVIKMVELSPKKSPTQSPKQLSEASPKNLNTKIYTLEELNKLTIVNIKEIAKQLNIVLSVTGKLKNKATLVSDIIRLQE